MFYRPALRSTGSDALLLEPGSETQVRRPDRRSATDRRSGVAVCGRSIVSGNGLEAERGYFVEECLRKASQFLSNSVFELSIPVVVADLPGGFV